MTDQIRQGIHFDMDTKALQRYYPKVSWTAAYEDIRSYLLSKGFEHEQGSGYHSTDPMAQSDAIDIIAEMIDVYPWLHKCIKVCTIADVPITYDLTTLFDKNANIPVRDTNERKSALAQIRDFQKEIGASSNLKKRTLKHKDDQER